MMTTPRPSPIKKALIKSLVLWVLLACSALVFPVAGHAQSSLKPDPNAVFPVELLSVKTSAGIFQFTVEIADEDHERARGLMFREKMALTHGMLFDFGSTEQVYMWMENTPRALDMVFIGENGEVVNIARNTVPFSREVIASAGLVSHVLEINAGMAAQIGLKAGDTIIHRFFP